MHVHVCPTIINFLLGLSLCFISSRRGETILSGVIIRPDPEDPSNSTKMSVMLQNDVKGWIPHFVVNAFAAKAPVDWHDGLANYYANFYSQKDKNEEGDTTQKGQGTTEEGDKDAETQGQSTSVAEGGEVEGQSANSEGGESQVVSAETEEQPKITVEVTADTAGEAIEKPAESEPNNESSKTEATADQ